MRCQGTETTKMVLKPKDGDYVAEFLRIHLREFSFVFPSGGPILVDDIFVRGVGKGDMNDEDGKLLGEELVNMKFTPVPKSLVKKEVSLTI